MDRADRDDGALAGRHHGTGASLGAHQGARDVVAQGGLQVFDLDVRRHLTALAAAGVADHHIEPLAGLPGPLHHDLHGGLVGRIGRMGMG